MEYLNTIFNEDCFNTMDKLDSNICDVILTSPPYNMTNRKGGISDTGRYDVYNDWLTVEDYLKFSENLFNKFNKVLIKNGVVLYNFSYSIETPSLPFLLVSHIEKTTDFRLVDTIIWKKKNGLPFPANARRLCRTWEFIFVFVRNGEENTYNCYKGVSKVSEKTNQTYYNIFYNFIDAKNNDEKCPYNQATYSSEMCIKLLTLYAKEGGLVYDPFMGSGTTAIACKKLGLNYIGSEISKNQVDWANERIANFLKNCEG